MEKNNGDDFEFKPLTVGLGFHKKTIDLRENSLNFSEGPVSSREISTGPLKRSTTGFMPKSKTTAPSSAEKTAPRSPNPSYSLNPPPWTPILNDKKMGDLFSGRPAALGTLDLNANLTPARATSSTAIKPKLSPVAVNWPAALFDAAMILGMGLLFSAVVFALTKIDLNDLGAMLKNETGAQIATYLLLLAVFEIYCVSCRSFFGKTLGEWAFDCRLGDAHDQESIFYPLAVAWRTLIIALTGFIALPLLSTLLGRDIAGVLSGVSVYSERR